MRLYSVTDGMVPGFTYIVAARGKDEAIGHCLEKYDPKRRQKIARLMRAQEIKRPSKTPSVLLTLEGMG